MDEKDMTPEEKKKDLSLNEDIVSQDASAIDAESTSSGAAEKKAPKNENPKKKDESTKKIFEGEKRSKPNLLLMIVCIFLGVVVIFTGVAGIMIAVRNSHAVAIYENVTVDEGVANFLASRCKVYYLAELRAAGVDGVNDTEAFYLKTAEDGRTYGEIFEEKCKNYIAEIMVAARLFDIYGTYTRDDDNKIAKAVSEFLKNKAENSVSKFNEIAEDYGFDYDDFVYAAHLLYKADQTMELIYGDGGENLKSFPDQCNEYLDTYSHVSLLFIRSEDKIVVSEEDGSTSRVPLTSDEIAERAALIADISTMIKNREEGTTGEGIKWIDPQIFADLVKKSTDGDPDMADEGYYFHASAETTAEFSEAFPEVVARSFEMSIGDYARVDCAIPSSDGSGYDFKGVCFIYKSEPENGAYSDETNVFFSDFYSDAAMYLYPRMISELTPDVQITPLYDAIMNVVTIPKNTKYYIKSWE